MRKGEDLAAHYASGDLFLFPSLTETYGNVTLEAMASGLAVVAFDYAAAAEVIRHGANGLLAPYGDAESFARLAAGLAADPARARRARRAGALRGRRPRLGPRGAAARGRAPHRRRRRHRLGTGPICLFWCRTTENFCEVALRQ